MALRITGGELRGRALRAPKGQGVRPTSGKIREALFSMLGQDLSGQRVLDLCAGAGSLGIEAGSRGAQRVVFVEQSRDHLRLLRENAALLDGLCDVAVRQGDARRAVDLLARQGESFDLVFMDPPYGQGLAEALIERLDASPDLVASDAVVVAETEASAALPSGVGKLVCAGPRTYGDTAVWIYREPENGT